MNNGFEKALKAIPVASEFKRVENYKHWKSIMTSIAKEYEVNEATMLSAINIRVADKVTERLYSREFLTLEAFWTYMDEAFGDTHNTARSQNLHELLNPPASVKNIEEYFTHFDEYSGRLPGAFQNEEDKILVFTASHNPVLVQAVLSNNPKTLEETKKFVRSNSLMLKGDITRNNLQRTSSKMDNNGPGEDSAKTSGDKLPLGEHQIDTDAAKKYCGYCKQNGHFTGSCRFRQNNGFQSNGYNRYYKQRNIRTMNSKSQRNSLRHFIDIRDNSKN